MPSAGILWCLTIVTDLHNHLIVAKPVPGRGVLAIIEAVVSVINFPISPFAERAQTDEQSFNLGNGIRVDRRFAERLVFSRRT